MKTLKVEKFKCEICDSVYDTAKEAQTCESRPVSQDKGAQVGDKVRVTNGDGAGQLATVRSRSVYSREWGHYEWGHYFWETFWHTVGVTADFEDNSGTRQLTFQDYEVLK